MNTTCTETTMTHIAAAVQPLKQATVDRSVAMMQRHIESVRTALEGAGWDLNLVAAYPHSRMSRPEYMQKKARYEFFNRLTRWAESSHRPGTPLFVVWSDEAAARLLVEAAEMAAASYEAFVAKLEAKVGEHSEAKLIVNGTWAYSVLEVITPVGVQRWKTQQIVNVSVLGKLFNQWPTRLMK